MAGLDGIQNKIHPGEAMDENLYKKSEAELKHIPKVSASLEQSIAALRDENEFLLRGGVFSEDLINSYLELRQKDLDYIKNLVHPAEFELYYSQ